MVHKIRIITTFVLVATIVFLVGYDVIAALLGTTDATISWVIWTDIHEYPVIAFAAGFLCGHLFWSQTQ